MIPTGFAQIVSALCTQYYAKDGELRPGDESFRLTVEKAISDFADEVRRPAVRARRPRRTARPAVARGDGVGGWAAGTAADR